MRNRTRVAGAAILLLAMVSCGEDKVAQKPAVAFEGTIVLAGMVEVEVEGDSGTTMASAIYLLDAQGARVLTSNGAIQDANPA